MEAIVQLIITFLMCGCLFVIIWDLKKQNKLKEAQLLSAEQDRQKQIEGIVNQCRIVPEHAEMLLEKRKLAKWNQEKEEQFLVLQKSLLQAHQEVSSIKYKMKELS